MSEYPDSDWPYSFYFNGHELPKWSSQWHLCSLSRFLSNFEDDWDEWIGYKHIWFLQNRLDHLGNIESEDPLILRVCAQEVLLTLIQNRGEVIKEIHVNESGEHSAAEILWGIIEGLAKMIELSAQDSLATWTNGYAADQARLALFLSDFRSREKGGDFVNFPHILERKSELERRSGFQLRDLRTIAQNGTLDKRLRTLVNQLPPSK